MFLAEQARTLLAASPADPTQALAANFPAVRTEAEGSTCKGESSSTGAAEAPATGRVAGAGKGSSEGAALQGGASTGGKTAGGKPKWLRR